MANEKSAVCPICGSDLSPDGKGAKCRACGYLVTAEKLDKMLGKNNSYKDLEIYRLMSSADAFFSKKAYEEAYVGYGTVLDRDGGSLKAYFRRELTSRYLMMETSTSYLSANEFFTRIKEIKERADESGDEKLVITMAGDMLNYISVRADYGKKYASLHKNKKTAETFMADTLQLFEYLWAIMKELAEKGYDNIDRTRAALIVDCCSAGMKIRGMLITGAEFVENVEKMEEFSNDPSAKNVSKIRRRKLSPDDELEVETIAGNMQKTKKELLAALPPELYAELSEKDEKAETSVKTDEKDDDKKRMEYGLWRARNEKEYAAADRKILLFNMIGKASLIISAMFIVVFLFELLIGDKLMGPLIVFAVIAFALHAVMRTLEKKAKKKKGFYAKIIEGDSVNMRTVGVDFKDLDK